ncbi:Uncharacterized protein PBTT_10416 [Plasmodiophora brassicae]
MVQRLRFVALMFVLAAPAVLAATTLRATSSGHMATTKKSEPSVTIAPTARRTMPHSTMHSAIPTVPPTTAPSMTHMPSMSHMPSKPPMSMGACKAVDPRATDFYCTAVCNANPPFCPPNFCSCEGRPSPGHVEQKHCKAVDRRATDFWCMATCNNNPPDCPPQFCSCTTMTMGNTTMAPTKAPVVPSKPPTAPSKPPAGSTAPTMAPKGNLTTKASMKRVTTGATKTVTKQATTGRGKPMHF